MAEIDKVGKDARQTYGTFLNLTKNAIIAIVLVLVGMAVFLV